MAVPIHLDAGVMTITLNRPGALNALTQAMMRRLSRELTSAASDPDVHVVLLRGAGRAFCAGGDRKQARTPDPEDPIAAKWSGDPVWSEPEMRFDRLRGNVRSVELLRSMPKPTIAMLRGPVVGAGLGLALACDFRVTSKGSTFRAGFAAAGYSGDFGLAYLLGHLVGGARARELLMLDRWLDAEQALHYGLITQLVDDESLERESDALARRLASGPRIAYRYMKQNLLAAEGHDFAHALDLECMNMVRSSLTQDAVEARTAFAEKRAPRFTGR